MIIIDKHIITEAFQNLSNLQFKRQRKLKESFGWERIDRKQVQDSDGFWTDYTLWYNSNEDRYMCIFGDDDLYNPMNAFPDFECETEEEAREWFDSYNGFSDDEDEYYDDWMDESLKEDTVKQGKHWVNKGDSGKTHGKFATKKAADAQRKAMFANGYKAESLNEESSDSIGVFHNDNGIDYDIIERSESGRNLLLRHPRGSKWIVAWDCPRDNQGSWGQGHYFFDEMSARKLWNKEYANK